VKDQIRVRIGDHSKEQIADLQTAAESWNPQRSLSWAFETFGNHVAISSAFGAEGMVLIDMASRQNKNFRLFTIDTEFLFPETYATRDRVIERYGLQPQQVIQVKSLLTPEAQVAQYGEALWTRHPDQCCELRKVEPLTRVLKGFDAWITGIR